MSRPDRVAGLTRGWRRVGSRSSTRRPDVPRGRPSGRESPCGVLVLWIFGSDRWTLTRKTQGTRYIRPGWSGLDDRATLEIGMDDLYRDYILEHSRRPHNFGVLEEPTASHEGANPLCGDRITMQLGIRDGRSSTEVAFTGRGCAISQASASLLTDEVKGEPSSDGRRPTGPTTCSTCSASRSARPASSARCSASRRSTARWPTPMRPLRHHRSRARGGRGSGMTTFPPDPLHVSLAGLTGGTPTPSASISPVPPDGGPPNRSPDTTCRSHMPSSCARPAHRSARSARPRSNAIRERGDAVDRRRPRGVASGSRATCPAPSTSRKSYVEQQIEAAVPDRDDRSSSTAPAASARCSRPRRSRRWATPTSPRWPAASRPGRPTGCRGRCRPSLTAEQKQRYSRHLLIPEVGTDGQAKLLDSKVLLIGAGGLGCPAALYLAAAGVGTIGIVDFDVVDLSNLQRQVIHTTDRIGEKKVDSARRDDRGAQPRREGRRPRGDARRRQRRADHRRLRRDPRRDRHVRDALHCSTTRRSSRTSRSSTPRSSGSRAS